MITLLRACGFDMHNIKHGQHQVKGMVENAIAFFKLVVAGADVVQQPAQVPRQAADFAAFQNYFTGISSDGAESAGTIKGCRSAALAAWREATRRAEDRFGRADPVPAASVQPDADEGEKGHTP